jgi:hypothetical protein
MSTKFTIALALAAGFAGGLASHFCVPPSAGAQEKPPIPREIRAHRFVLVDENGATQSVLGFVSDGSPDLQIARDKWIMSLQNRLLAASKKDRMFEPPGKSSPNQSKSK